MDDLPGLIREAIRSVVGQGRVPLHEPSFHGNEHLYVKECIDSTFVSSVGVFVDRFERDLARFTGSRNAVALVNGTTSLQLALKLAGVRAADEVLVPALTFVATSNAVMHCDAVPHFVDSEESTLGVDAAKLREYLEELVERRGAVSVNKRTGRVIRALIVMHTFGHPANLQELVAVADDFQLNLVEDAAESLGSYFEGRHTGTFGLLGTLSFNGNKTVTTGGGGAILTDDDDLAQRARHLATTAKVPHPWEYFHDEVGYNFRMPNINAALGCAQLENLPEFLASKRRLTSRYASALASVPHLKLLTSPAKSESNYWLQTIVLEEQVAHQRDAVLETTNRDGLMTRPAWTLMHRLPPFRGCPKAPLLVAESLERRIINIPSSASLA